MMMSELFKITLSLSLSGAAMILIVLLFGKLFRNRISSNWRYYIWLLVVLRLLVPYSPEISVLGTLFQGEAGRSIVESAPVSQAETPAKPDTVLSVPANPVPDPVPNPAPTDRDVQERPMPAERNNVITILQTLISWLWLTWLVVALILFIRKITMYQSFAKYVRAGQTDVTDETLLMEFGEICGQAGVKRAIELRINNLIASPLLLGIFRPCVILPTTAMPREDRRYIYLHELTHYKRGDIFYKWLLQLALCLHWFNPLVYLMVREANQACELSCDASVIRSMDTEERRGYGDALLKSLESPGSYRESLAAVTLHENSVLLKERLESIKNYTKNNKWRAVVSVILCLVIFAGGFALGAYLPNRTVISETNGGELTPEGLPIMSASNRNVYEKYVGNIAITGLLWRNFSPEDISTLLERDGASLLTLANALEREEFEKNDWFDGAVPADFADTVLSDYFPLSKDKVREVCADIYDAQTNTYQYTGGLGGGPATPIVTGFNQNGKLLTIYYTWYIRDPAANEFRYKADDSGELIIELSGNTFRYLSNRVIENSTSITDTDAASSAEGYNIREKYGLIVINDWYEKMLMALVWNNITKQSWESPEEIDPDRLIDFFVQLSTAPYGETEIKKDEWEIDEEIVSILMPSDEVEPAIQRHFDVGSEHLRSSMYYIPEKDAYWLGGLGSVANAKITSVRQDGEIHSIDYELYHDIKLVGNGTLNIRMGEDEVDYQYLSNEFTPIPLSLEQQKQKDTYIQISKDMTLEEKIVAALVCSRNATISWNRADERPQYDLLSIYDFMVQIGEVAIPENVEYDPYWKSPYLPADDVEAVVTSYYDVTVEYLREYHGYDPERQTYTVSSSYNQDIRLIDAWQDGNLLRLRFEVYFDYELSRTGEITAALLENGGFRYVSCVVD